MNTKYFRVLASLIAIAFCVSCKDTSTPASSIPVINFLGQSPATIKYQSSKDTLFIQFGFVDDKDLSGSKISCKINFEKGDSLNIKNLTFPIVTDPSVIDPVKGISGTAYIILPAPYIFLDTNQQKKLPQNAKCTIYLTDVDGNNSNSFVTNDFYMERP